MLGAGAVASFCSTFVAGYLVKHWGPKRTIRLGLAVIASGLTFFAATPGALTNILLSVLIGGRPGGAIGFAATGGGVGSFVFPLLMSALSQGWGIRAGFATYAVFAVAMTLAAAGLVLSAVKRRKR